MWIITKDFINTWDAEPFGETFSRINVKSKDFTLEVFDQCNKSTFRIYDADGELYYEGLFAEVGEYDCEFDPLDDFATPNDGAVEIRYKSVDGKFYQI